MVLMLDSEMLDICLICGTLGIRVGVFPLEITSNAYATLAANFAFFGGDAVAASSRERRGNPRRRAGGAGRRDDAFAARLGHCRAQAVGRDCQAQRAAGA